MADGSSSLEEVAVRIDMNFTKKAIIATRSDEFPS